VAHLLRDRYLAVGEPRPLSELHASLEAAGRGILSPAVVAGAVYPAGAFYRADLVTEEIPGGMDLAEILFGEAARPVAPPAVPRLAALAAAGELVRRLAEAGLRHPDLNAKNIVLEASTGGPRAWLVDLDGCRFAPGASREAGRVMRRRLERSLRTLATRSGRALVEDEWAALAERPGPPERRP
jgi:3-deoxy-D-manno-octulosonic acid kinase